jgi:acetaldehyde dehydrogenase/alcohol dehydrogenase
LEESVSKAFLSELLKQHAAILTPLEIAHFTKVVFDKGKIRHNYVGKSAQDIAAAANIERDYPIKVIVIPCERSAIVANNPYANEKLAPILSLFLVPDAITGIDVCEQILTLNGCGHTAVIYTKKKKLIKAFSLRIPASRILINSPSVHGVFGESTNLSASCTLSCGTFGGNSTTDSIGYTHLRNTKYVARYKA